MGSLFIILFLGFGGVSSGDPPLLTPILYLSTRHSDHHMLTCSPSTPKETTVQVHWKEKHANGSYSLIGVQNPVLGNYTAPRYKAVVNLDWKSNATYILEVQEEMVVCCVIVTYPHGVSQESCVTAESKEADPERPPIELLVVLSLGGVFFMGSFIILCHICWTRNRKVHSLRGETQRVPRRRSETRPLPYNRTTFSRTLEYNPMSSENHGSLPREHDRLHRSLAQRNQLPLPDPPARNWQPFETQHSESQWHSEEPAPQEPSGLKSPTQWSYWSPKVPSAPDMIYSNVLRKKAKVTRTSWSIPTSTSPSDVVINTRPLWFAASYSHEEVTPLQASAVQDDSPLCAINPMYHRGTQWTSTQLDNNSL